MNYEQTSALVSALEWLQKTLLGTVATTIAVLAIASVGALMLTGRIGWRHAARVIVGCFILFGATQIAMGLKTAVGGDTPALPGQVPASEPPPPAKPPVVQYDPYAGASVNRGQ